MAILKCKMCGGDIEVMDKTYGTCDSCGSMMTLPKIEEDKKANWYNRANNFRRSHDFDKAVSAYEYILNEDNTEAEAHWGLVLSKHGIEYVVDPSTQKRVPTCHRTQVENILTDSDYLQALEFTDDATTKSLYETEAKAISEIQKGILAISNKEEPYDVFICYKETDESGKRTVDSTIAQDIYYQLTQEGLKVFFARITLESKIGAEYEPYIFAALNSSKVMLALGTKPEFYNAVWVKNEWARYLSIMKKDRNRLMVPCYRDMDAYDLPDELSIYQSQDMSKIGFIQDLIRGIKKVVVKEEAVKVERVTEVINQEVTAGVDALLRRAEIFLGDGDFEQAKEYYNKALDIEPECVQAYLGLTCIDLNISSLSDMGKFYYGKEHSFAPEREVQAFYSNKNYLKARKFAQGDTLDKLNLMEDGLRENHKEQFYLAINEQKEAANDYATYMKLRDSYIRLCEYKDAEQLANQCEVLARAVVYEEGISIKNGVHDMERAAQKEAAYWDAVRKFKLAKGYQDWEEQIAECEHLKNEVLYNEGHRLKEIAEKSRQIQEYTESILVFNRVAYYKDAKAQIKELNDIINKMNENFEKRNKKICIAVAAVSAVILTAGLFVTTIVPMRRVNKVMNFMSNGEVTQAIAYAKDNEMDMMGALGFEVEQQGDAVVLTKVDTTVTEFTIPASVTEIGYSAFRDCTSLTSVEIPDSVTEIGTLAFMGRYSLDTITINKPEGSLDLSWAKIPSNTQIIWNG